MNRTKKHIFLAGLTILSVVVFYLLLDAKNSKSLLSMSTAYTGMILLAVTLAIGPLNLIQNKINPVSTFVRRDIGIWAGVVSIIHVIIGLQVHFGGQFTKYFFHVTDTSDLVSIRFDAFGLANHTGLIATLIFIVLLILSNNFLLKKIGAMRWKNIQRLNYLLFLLVIIHGFIYQLLEKRQLPFIGIVILVFLIVLGLQFKGFKLHTKR